MHVTESHMYATLKNHTYVINRITRVCYLTESHMYAFKRITHTHLTESHVCI